MFLCSLLNAYSSQDTLRYTLNLRETENGKIRITANLPAVAPITWQMPAIVPGTYKIYDFGRFISDFSAKSPDNQEVSFSQEGINAWNIFASGPVSIQYTAHQTRQKETEGKNVFEPAGTIYQKGEVFLLNPFAAFGYIRNQVRMPIRLTLILPDSFHAATAQPVFRKNADTIEFVYNGYHQMADQPLLISKPETAVLNFNNCQVLVAVYDPQKIAPAGKIAEQLKRILDAQQQYLGGKLPVDNYAFLIFLDPDFNIFGSYGALEHNYCSMYYLPSFETDWVYEQMRDIGAHEFFHILTPLNLHSEHIQNFNFEKPEMSRHLWLYEGVTEYASHLVQVQYDIKSEKDFLATLREKILEAEEYRQDISMTDMSLGCLDTFESEYQSVYSKGALVGMCLDLILRNHMPDQSGLPELMQKLARKYGKDKPFADTALFRIIEEASVPQAGTFLREYVGQARPLPLVEVLRYAGFLFLKEKTAQGLTLGGMEINVNPESGRMTAWETENMDAFGKKIGFRDGDEFMKLNGKDLSLDSLETVFSRFFEEVQVGDKVEFLLRRTRPNGKSKLITRSARMIYVEYTQKYVIERIPDATEKQQAIRKAWLRRFE